MGSKKLGMLACGALVALGMVGCTTFDKDHDRYEPKGWFDPGAVGRWQGEPLLRPILPTLGTQFEEPDQGFANATDVRPEDLKVQAVDYVIGANDLLNVSVTDLVGPGVETVKTTRVSESGNVSLPLIGQIHATDLTEAELEKVIQQSYRDANLIQNAQVSVTVAEARARTFSILGSVAAPGQYAIINADFRLLDALVLARDINAQGVDEIYVIRPLGERDKQGDNATTRPANSATEPTGGPNPDLLAPQSKATAMARPALMQNQPSTAATTRPAELSPSAAEDGGRVVMIDGKPRAMNPDSTTTAPAMKTPMVEATQPAGGGDFAFNDLAPVTDQRIIRVPLAALKNGDLRYNIVIRPKDMILAPLPSIGEYYMGGHVARVGVYSLTGRKITLKQAVVSAGMFDGLAIPARTELIRRVGENQEIFVKLDLDSIFAGSQPDVFLKPNDMVNVGTNVIAPFMAAVRGAFRITYGFGFLYDRNFAYTDVNQTR